MQYTTHYNLTFSLFSIDSFIYLSRLLGWNAAVPYTPNKHKHLSIICGPQKIWNGATKQILLYNVSLKCKNKTNKVRWPWTTLSNPSLTCWLKAWMPLRFSSLRLASIMIPSNYIHVKKIEAWKIWCGSFPSNGVFIHDLCSLYITLYQNIARGCMICARKTVSYSSYL